MNSLLDTVPRVGSIAMHDGKPLMWCPPGPAREIRDGKVCRVSDKYDVVPGAEDTPRETSSVRNQWRRRGSLIHPDLIAHATKRK